MYRPRSMFRVVAKGLTPQGLKLFSKRVTDNKVQRTLHDHRELHASQSDRAAAEKPSRFNFANAAQYVEHVVNKFICCHTPPLGSPLALRQIDSMLTCVVSQCNVSALLCYGERNGL